MKVRVAEEDDECFLCLDEILADEDEVVFVAWECGWVHHSCFEELVLEEDRG